MSYTAYASNLWVLIHGKNGMCIPTTPNGMLNDTVGGANHIRIGVISSPLVHLTHIWCGMHFISVASSYMKAVLSNALKK